MASHDLEAVFLANRPALLRFVQARGAGGDTEDVIQDLWLKSRAVDGAALHDPVAFLYRMANNLLLDRKRSALRSARREQAWNLAVSPDENTLRGAPTIEEALVAREQLTLVERRLAALGERTAAIFRRFRIDGCGRRQIAEEQGISVSAVEKHLRKCYRLLAGIRDAADADSGEPERQCIEGANDERR